MKNYLIGLVVFLFCAIGCSDGEQNYYSKNALVQMAMNTKTESRYFLVCSFTQQAMVYYWYEIEFGNEIVLKHKDAEPDLWNARLCIIEDENNAPYVLYYMHKKGDFQCGGPPIDCYKIEFHIPQGSILNKFDPNIKSSQETNDKNVW